MKAAPSEELAKSVEDSGFAVVPNVLDKQTLILLCAVFGDAGHAQRNLLDVPAVRSLAVAAPVRQLVTSVLGQVVSPLEAFCLTRPRSRIGKCSGTKTERSPFANVGTFRDMAHGP